MHFREHDLCIDKADLVPVYSVQYMKQYGIYAICG